MMKIFLIILSLFSTFSHAKYSEKYISKAIKSEKIFYCFEDEKSKKRIVFDRYRNRLYHYPFNNYNNVKVFKYKRIDDENPVYKTAYIEFINKQRVAVFTLTTQGNNFWEATYKDNKSPKELSLNSTTYNLTILDAVCYDDINN